jgi:hypothetical protein
MQHLGAIKGTNPIDPLERPQTANVLSNIEEANRMPKTAASTNSIQMNSSHSRGFGELGSTKRDKNFKASTVDDELSDETSSDNEQAKKEGEMITCPNCNKEILKSEAAIHTV